MSMTLLPIYAKSLLDWQPSAFDIRDSGTCPDCKSEAFLFYAIPSFERTVRFWRFNEPEIAQDTIGGYFFCANCNLCGTGFVQGTEYRKMEVYDADKLE